MPSKSQLKRTGSQKLSVSQSPGGMLRAPIGSKRISHAEFNALRKDYDVPSLHKTGGVVDYFVDPSTGAAVYIKNSVADWAALQAIPKTAENDTITMLVESANRLMRYNHAITQWQPVDSNQDMSIMWIGDSLTAQAGVSCHPLLTARVPYYMAGVTGLTNINSVGNYITAARCDPGCSAAAGGNLVYAYNYGAPTITWTAPGDTAGPATSVLNGGWIKCESGTAGMAIYLTIYAPNQPLSDKSDSLSLLNLFPLINNNTQISIPGWFNAAFGNPWAENQYWYCGEGFTASSILTNLASWRDVYSDVTFIDLGTNAVLSLASADTEYASILSIIAYRQAVGSRVIVKAINISNVSASTAGDKTRRAKNYLNSKLLKYAKTLGFEFIDTNKWLMSPTGVLRTPARSDCFNTDLLHLSAKGAYIAAVNAVEPVLRKYYPVRTPNGTAAMQYDATECPSGNLLTIGQFLGTGGTKGVYMTGDLATSWAAARAAGTTITGVGVMPQSGSPIARTDGVPGNWAQITVDNTNVGNANGEGLRIVSSIISGSNYAAGDSLILSGEAEVELVSGSVWGLEIFFAATNSGRAYGLRVGGNSSMNAILWDIDGKIAKFTFESLPLTLLSGATNLAVYIDMYMAAASVAKFRIAPNLTLRKVL